jgi:quinol monooxygenase YgiN
MGKYLLVVADLVCAPENTAEFGVALEALAAACREEPGCLAYDVFQSPSQPERYVSIEKYVDAEAFDAHRKADHFKEIGLGRVIPLTVSRDVRMYGEPQEIPPAR